MRNFEMLIWKIRNPYIWKDLDESHIWLILSSISKNSFVYNVVRSLEFVEHGHVRISH